MKNILATRLNIHELVDKHQQSMLKYQEAYNALESANGHVVNAGSLGKAAHPSISLHSRQDETEVETFHNTICLPDRETYLSTARKLEEHAVWCYLFERMGIARILDAEAKRDLRKRLQYNNDRAHAGNDNAVIADIEFEKGLPPLTVDNAIKVMSKLVKDADLLWMRGIANAFSSLDRRFKSHDGWKIGSRMIIDRLLDDNGYMGYGDRLGPKDRLLDVERMFLILDGKEPVEEYGSIVAEIDQRKKWKPHQSEHEGEYFKIRIFKNGNAHLWFTRDNLLEKVNKVLAEYYGEVLGDNHTEHKSDPLDNRNMALARNFGFFPTPEPAAARLVEAGLIQEGDRILEPSAGTGNLVKAILKYGRSVDIHCVEIQRDLCDKLNALPVRSVKNCSFLELSPARTGLFDRIIMNPPFDRQRDIDHVTHAIKFLKPGGKLVSIMSAGIEYRDNAKAVAFRKLVKPLYGDNYTALPAGSFSSVGTNINTVIVEYTKPKD